jgi:ABC-type phosphate transport system substrate-binding protein
LPFPAGGLGRRLAAATLTLLALPALAATPAAADPVPGQVTARDVVGAAGDTTAPLLDQFSLDYNASLAAAGDTVSARLYNWDPTPAGWITPKPGGSTIPRPGGTRAGLSALNGSVSSTLDFTAASNGPFSQDPALDDFVALAKDAVSWAAPATGNAPANLTTADLKAIYTCTLTNWNQIGDIPGYTGPNAAIHPYLPPAGSGNRDIFLAMVNGSYTSRITPGSCVSPATPFDNEGTDPAFQDPNALVPYSVGHYVGQLNGHTTATDAPGPLTVRSIDGTAPLAAGAINSSFAATNYGRVIFNVVRDADWNATTDQGTALNNIFGPLGWVCNDPTAAADIASYGYQALDFGACGSITNGNGFGPVGVGATHKGMTWTVRTQQPNGEVHVGNDSTTNAYFGDTPATAVLPVLCLKVTGAGAPADITPDFYDGWAKGTLSMTSPVPGTALTSRAAADALCAAYAGPGAREAEHHDGFYGPTLAASGGWSYWGYGTLPANTRFWVAINDQPANPWN